MFSKFKFEYENSVTLDESTLTAGEIIYSHYFISFHISPLQAF